MAKAILQGNEARLKIKSGIDKAWAVVAPTLGAVGRTAIIEFKGLDPILADDGITVLKNLEFSDPYEQIGLQIYRKASMRTSTEGGDGTATTACLTHALVTQVFNELNEDGSNWKEVSERLTNGLEEVMVELRTIKRDITEDEIEQIAKISSLDADVAKIIAEVIKEVGVNGVVTVEKGAKVGYSKEVVKGARFDRGFISPYFIADQATNSSVLEDCYIVLVDRKISQNEQILSLLKSIGTGKSILFIADDVDSVALGTLAQNAQLKIANIACVRNPYQGQMARDFLFDIAALTGATVISEEQGMKLPEATVALCGKADKVIVTQGNTTIIGGHGGEALELRITALKEQIDNTISEYTKGVLEDRLAALTGGIGVIRVGAYTDTEFNAKKFKFENAVNATQAALQEGIVAGGGSALAKLGLSESIFTKSLSAPIIQMAKNAGMYRESWFSFFYKDYTWIAGWVKKQSITALDRTFETQMGWNFKTKEPVDMFKAGIIDSFKVTRLALESAVSVAQLLVSIEPIIVEEEIKKING